MTMYIDNKAGELDVRMYGVVLAGAPDTVLKRLEDVFDGLDPWTVSRLNAGHSFKKFQITALDQIPSHVYEVGRVISASDRIKDVCDHALDMTHAIKIWISDRVRNGESWDTVRKEAVEPEGSIGRLLNSMANGSANQLIGQLHELLRRTWVAAIAIQRSKDVVGREFHQRMLDILRRDLQTPTRFGIDVPAAERAAGEPVIDITIEQSQWGKVNGGSPSDT